MASANFGIATGALIEERDDWRAALARVAAEDWRVVELTAITEERLDAFQRLLEHDSLVCSGFERVTAHAPVRFDSSIHDVVTKLRTLSPSYDLILHPDLYAEAPAVAGLGQRAVFENMDIQKGYGRTVSDLRPIFDRWSDAGFCLDVAHVWTNDPSLVLADDLLNAFGDTACDNSTSPGSSPMAHTDRPRKPISSSTTLSWSAARTYRGCSKRNSSAEQLRLRLGRQSRRQSQHPTGAARGPCSRIGRDQSYGCDGTPARRAYAVCTRGRN